MNDETIRKAQEQLQQLRKPEMAGRVHEEDIKGCSGECDLCPEAGDCEQCGSV